MCSPSKPTVSLIIPVHNGGENFRRCLSSLGESTPTPEEIIVVADGVTDGFWRLAQDFGSQVLRIPTLGGPARARNLGARKSKGDILFFVDADVTIPPDALNQIVVAFQNDPDLAAVLGSYDDEPFETNFLSRYKNLFHHYVHQSANAEASTFWGVSGAIRREVFLAMGGFDEGYRRPSIVDIDLGYRLKGAGYRIRLLKNLKVKHLKRRDVLSLLKADFFYRALPWTALILNEKRFIDDLNLKISNRISVISVFMLLLTLLGALWISWLIVPFVCPMVLLLGLNWDLHRFFKDMRGMNFALKTLPWHCFYFLYSGLAFSLGFAKVQIMRIGKWEI